MPVFNTTTITVQYTGVAISPDNFQINIIDYNNTSRIYNNTDVTKVSRGTLLSGYNVSGITPGDVTIRATASGACSTYADVDISTLALQYYTPTVTASYDVPSIPYSFTKTTAGVVVDIGITTTYSYISNTDFSLSHVSTSGNGVAGGPLTNLSVVTSGVAGNYYLRGDSKSMATDATLNNSTYRLTYIPNGNYVDFTFYWVVDL